MNSSLYFLEEGTVKIEKLNIIYVWRQISANIHVGIVGINSKCFCH
jgi:hypothetical protein